MADGSLLVFLGGSRAARIDRIGRELRLRYDGGYIHTAAASPLSLSLPLNEPEITGRRVEGWMSGLLPGNAEVRVRWAAKHGEASTAPFDLLSTRIGLDCPGAVQFCPPARAEEIEQRSGGVVQLTAADLDDLIAGMVRESSRWVRPFGHSSFSLAGAQAKTALHRRDGRWCEPWGDTPSTHILKPSMRDLRDQAVNEHLCLTAARYCGLAAALTEIDVIGGHEVLVARRYDRVRSADDPQRIHRVHQEDLHQACGDVGASIYQDDRGGGHSIQRLARLIAEHSADRTSDLRAFFDALAFNWVVCNTDAHSKNYSLLFTGRSVRFAPLYDIWSILPYDPDHYRAHTLAMSVLPTLAMSTLPDRRILAADSRRSWEATAIAVRLDRSEGPDRAAAIAEATPGAITRAADELDAGPRSSPVVQSLVSMAQHRRTQCLKGLSAG